MDINGIGAAGYFAMYGMRGTVASMVEKCFTDEISKAVERLEKEELYSGKSITKTCRAENDVGKTSELEDKYCSLCGSMIKEDGSCPLCGVPTFISGNGRSGNQKIAQAASSHIVLKSTTVRMK